MFLRITEGRNLLKFKDNIFFFLFHCFQTRSGERDDWEDRKYVFSLWNSVVCEIHKGILFLFSLFPPSFLYCLIHVSTGANTWKEWFCLMAVTDKDVAKDRSGKLLSWIKLRKSQGYIKYFLKRITWNPIPMFVSSILLFKLSFSVRRELGLNFGFG